MVKINGKNENADGLSVFEYLSKADFNLSRIAVEINGEIVPKSQYETTVFCDGDSVEIVSFVGGG